MKSVLISIVRWTGLVPGAMLFAALSYLILKATAIYGLFFIDLHIFHSLWELWCFAMGAWAYYTAGEHIAPQKEVGGLILSFVAVAFCSVIIYAAIDGKMNLGDVSTLDKIIYCLEFIGLSTFSVCNLLINISEIRKHTTQ